MAQKIKMKQYDQATQTFNLIHPETEADIVKRGASSNVDADLTAVETAVGQAFYDVSKSGATVTLYHYGGGQDTFTFTAQDLGVGNAIKYIGRTTTALTDGATTNPITIYNPVTQTSSSYTAVVGDVVVSNTGGKEFIYANGSDNVAHWEQFGQSGSFKTIQTAKTSPSTSGSNDAFIDTISQDTNGVITATKKSVQDGKTSQKGIVQLYSGDCNGATYQDAVAVSKAHTHTQYLTSASTLDASKLSGTVAVANGGTGQTTLANAMHSLGNASSTNTTVTSAQYILGNTGSGAFKIRCDNLANYVLGQLSTTSNDATISVGALTQIANVNGTLIKAQLPVPIAKPSASTPASPYDGQIWFELI